jgi:HK97 family phage prohead protease
MHNVFSTALEVKFSDGAAGSFSGYGAVFGNQDSHGDVIMPGAFADSLAERKSQGRGPIPMHVMHRGMFGGDGLPVGVWTSVAEDERGLKVEGKISGMNTDAGRLIYERVKDGALGGLSIGYSLRRKGAVYGKEPGEPKRTLKALNLHEVSLVDDPSNPMSRVAEIKSGRKAMGDPEEVNEPAGADIDDAIEAIAAAIVMQDKIMQGYSYSGNAKDAALLMDRLRDAHFALTGQRAPDGLDGWTKRAATIREIERVLREEFKLSRSQAAEIAARRFSTAEPRDEGSAPATAREAIGELSSTLSGFKLPQL